jgi:hypothetical protein
MLRYLFIIVVAVHGLIHFMGFAKAFGYADMKQLTIPISKPAGILWIITALLFTITALLLLFNKTGWYIIAIPSVILSQVLLVMSWKDAKFGTIANFIIITVAITTFAQYRFNHTIENISSSLLAKKPPDNKTVVSGEVMHQPPSTG